MLVISIYFLFQQCFQKVSYTGLFKSGMYGEELKPFHFLAIYRMTKMKIFFQKENIGTPNNVLLTFWYMSFPAFSAFSPILQRPFSFSYSAPPHQKKKKHCLAEAQPFPKQALVFMCLKYKSFKNTVGKGELLVTSNFSFSNNIFSPFHHFQQI